ncbi:MAG: hypothetical protein M9938_03410 [Solirubrobacterales bacterium]|nr:hypothetical protein [Solirubrobacterales bacterium]
MARAYPWLVRVCLILSATLLLLLGTLADSSRAGTGESPSGSASRSVSVILVPPASDLSTLDSSRWARGLISAGMGRVSPAQTMLDIGQGSRVASLTYGEPLPDPAYMPVPAFLDFARQRAAGASDRIEVGALRNALERAGVTVRLTRDRLARIAFSSPEHPERSSIGRPTSGRRSLRVVVAPLFSLESWRNRLPRGDLLIALEMPAGAATLDIAVAGPGFTGELSSPTTHLSPLVSSVDLAPTILTRLGLPIPDAMEGTPMAGGGSVRFGSIRQAEARLYQVRDRRQDLLTYGSALVAVFFLLAGLSKGRVGVRFASAQTAVGLPLAVSLLLVVTPFRLGSVAELPLVFVLASAGAWVLRRRLGDLPAFAAAAGIAITTVAIDLVFDLDLTPFSVLGSNPIGGVRFFGVGNELEAILACCLMLGLAAWGEARPGIARRRLAGMYAIAGAATLLVLVPGRFGADVGAMVTVAAGAATACLLLLRRSWKLIVAVLLTPFLLVGVFALIDTVTGGSSHFSRTVLGADSLGDAGEVLLSRLQKSAHTFTAVTYRPYLGLVLLSVAALSLVTDRFGNRLRGTRLAIGLWASAAALLFGAAGNDSGVLLILAGAPFVLAFWAMALTSEPVGRSPEESPAGGSMRSR